VQEERVGSKPHGAHVFLERGECLDSIAKKYGRDPANLCLKINYRCPLGPDESLEDFKGDHRGSVGQITRIQNICYLEGLAPRVYAIDIIDWEGERSVVQLVDFVPGAQEDRNPSLYEKVCTILEEFGVIGRIHGDKHWNSVAGKWVDFGSFSWEG